MLLPIIIAYRQPGNNHGITHFYDELHQIGNPNQSGINCMRMSAFVIVFGTVFKYNNDKRNGFCRIACFRYGIRFSLSLRIPI